MSVFFTLVLVLLGTATPIFAADPAVGPTESLTVPNSVSPMFPPSSGNMPAVTRWMDPLNRPPLKHDVQEITEPLRIDEVAPSSLNSSLKGLNDPAPLLGRICLVVHQDVYDLILEGLGQYEADLAAMGFEVTRYVYVSGSPESLRATLQQLYAAPGSLVGAVFVGEIPHVVFEMYDKFGQFNPENWTYTDFPCDLFFMDLDGEWSDILDDGEILAGNAKYDTWTGNQDLEIWVSRLMPAKLAALNTGNRPPAVFQAHLLNAYFVKNHRHRVGSEVPSYTGLVYNDDDWWGLGLEDVGHLERVFGASNVLSEWDPEITTKQDYLNNRIPLSPQLILLRSHGFSGGHLFIPDAEYVTARDYDIVDPSTPFFSLYVCSGSDYTFEDNLAGTIVLNSNGLGLLAWGSTKTGGMWNDGPFYESLAQGHVFGEAFRLWFNQMSREYAYSPDLIREWWYGMVLTGDAALKPILFSADLTATLTSGKVPLRVNFEDRTIRTLGPATKWHWDFGDGGTSSRQNPVYTYRKAGSYTVRLTVTAADGTTSTRVYANYINAYAPPRSIFAAISARGRIPLQVSFFDRSTGSITDWLWDFGDRQTSSARNPVHTYAAAGYYTVRLTVSGPGGTHTASRRICVLR